MIAHSRRPGQERCVTYEVPAGTQIVALKPNQSAMWTRNPHAFRTKKVQRFTDADIVERRHLSFIFTVNHPDGFDRIIVSADFVITHPEQETRHHA